MVNPNIAIHSVLEINEKKKELASKWEYFVSENQKPKKIRSQIYQSWRRCQAYGVDPHQKQTSVSLSQDKLTELVQKSQLYRVSLPVLKELGKQINGTEHLITLCDDKGRIIYLQGDYRIMKKAAKMNFVQGADWSEKAAGSNAIGTCIASGQPIQVFSFEHYCEGCHPWVCSAAPIKDPLTGKLLGVFDLTGPTDLAQPHTLGLAQNISAAIQQRFINISYKIRQILNDCYENAVKKWSSNTTILLDAMLNVITAGSKALSLLSIEDWRQLWSHPELGQLRTSILNTNEREKEVYLPNLQLNAYIQSIVLESERIGFLLHLEKTKKLSPLISDNNKYWNDLIGQSSAFKQAIQQAQIAAPTNVPILITGESGTGKEQFAQAIHQASSRHRSPFLAVNCGAIPKELIASELFGYEPGTFTGGNLKGKKGKFEEAHGGTLFFDEIGEMPLDLQVHLLRVLQEKEVVRLGSSQPIPVDVRIIAATNKDLNDLIDQGQFRPDLYFRLNVVELKLPPLRERKEDIVPLCRHFVAKSAKKLGKPTPTIDDQVYAYFQNYHWPGNIRELENAIEYAVLFCKDNRITITSLPESLNARIKTRQAFSTALTPLEQEEKRKIMQLLMATGGNLSEVARRCGIARTTLYRKLKKYNLR